MASIYERRWTTKAGKEKRAWRVELTTPAGQTIQRQFPTKREAHAFVADPKQWSAGTGASVEVIETSREWLARAETGADGGEPLERSTVAMYRGFIDNHIAPHFESMKWKNLREEDVEEFRDVVAKKVSRSTAKRILTMFRGVNRYARKRKFVDVNVSEDVKIADRRGRHVDRSSTRLAIHTREEVAAILARADALANDTDKRTAVAWRRYRVVLRLFYFAGLRASELRGLPRSLFDAKAGTIEVKQRADKWNTIGPPKSAAGYRTIQLPPDVADVLREWLKACKPGVLVFETRGGKPMMHTNLIKRMWNPVQAEAGVTRLNLHTARHFYASSLIDLGMKPLELQRLMGHSTPSLTLSVYGHLIRDPAALAEVRALVVGLTDLPTPTSDDDDED